MNRHATLVAEGLVYGPSYAYLNYLIHSPQPLDAETTWRNVTGTPGPAAEWLRHNYPPAFCRRALLVRKQRQDARLGIAAHYDVSNDFYELFLDKKYMFYSCADFVNGDETLEEAQTKKANFICGLIEPQAGERILELGCGWGSMLKHISAETGDKENLYGYTLSREQVTYNEAHNHFNVEFKNFITADYPENHFDKIYSIGAWEHVRPHEIPMLLAKLHRALKPGGRLVQHFFCRLSEKLPAAAVVSQLYFPGSVNVSFRWHCQAFEQAGFRIRHRSVHDYRPTVRAWFDNLVSQRERALELVDVTTYNRYVTFFPASWRYFEDMTGVVVRFILEKKQPAPRRETSSLDGVSAVGTVQAAG
jgi:cyclopropane-fatty-acyl-phospholipid synthase